MNTIKLNVPAVFNDTITSLGKMPRKKQEELYEEIFGQSPDLLERLQDEHVTVDRIPEKFDKSDLRHAMAGPYSNDPGSAYYAFFDTSGGLSELGRHALSKMKEKHEECILEHVRDYSTADVEETNEVLKACSNEELFKIFCQIGYSAAQVTMLLCN